MFVLRSFWFALAVAIAVRVAWLAVEYVIKRIRIDRWYAAHVYAFKQELGPYGIRLANKAEADRRIKESLAEVFVPNLNILKKNMEQLEVLDTLYRAGMRPDDESYHLHDCKIKYGRFRLERAQKNVNC